MLEILDEKCFEDVELVVLVVIVVLEMEEFGIDEVTVDDESEEAIVVTGTEGLTDVLDVGATVVGLGF